MLTKDKKKEILKELEEKAKNSKAVVFADYSGLSVKDLTDLRNKMREQGVEFKVARKTLVSLALEKAGLKEVDAKGLEGQIGLAFSNQDEIAAAKMLNDFAKKNDKLKIRGGVLEQKFIDVEKVLSLAKLPSKQELLAKLVGSISAPMSGLLNVCQGNLRGLVYALKALGDKKA